MRAIQITEFGGPEAIELVELPDPVPGPEQTLVTVTRAGVNFADTLATRNQYVAAQELPLVPGLELVGTTPEGLRVAAIVPNGAYAELAAVDVASLIRIPDGVDDDQAAALLAQGFSADAMLRISAGLKPGETIVVNAAAGGTGGLVVQIARQMGAGRIIGLASSPEKRDFVLGLGADVALDSRGADLTAELLAANDGSPVDVVVETAGGEAFDHCLEALAPFGRMVVFGIASRTQNEIRTGRLLKNSWTVTGFWMNHVLDHPELVSESLGRVFDLASSGNLRAGIAGTWPLADAAEALERIASGGTIGKLLIDPLLR
jgi:NADPH2:quinone reductase